MAWHMLWDPACMTPTFWTTGPIVQLKKWTLHNTSTPPQQSKTIDSTKFLPRAAFPQCKHGLTWLKQRASNVSMTWSFRRSPDGTLEEAWRSDWKNLCQDMNMLLLIGATNDVPIVQPATVPVIIICYVWAKGMVFEIAQETRWRNWTHVESLPAMSVWKNLFSEACQGLLEFTAMRSVVGQDHHKNFQDPKTDPLTCQSLDNNDPCLTSGSIKHNREPPGPGHLWEFLQRHFRRERGHWHNRAGESRYAKPRVRTTVVDN